MVSIDRISRDAQVSLLALYIHKCACCNLRDLVSDLLYSGLYEL